MGSTLVHARSGVKRSAAGVIGVAVSAALLFGPNALATSAELPGAANRHVTVLSRNVYHGVDAEITAIPGATGFPDLLQKVAAVYGGYHARDFPARAAQIAAEVDATQPALIGLQEAVMVRTDSPADGPATAAQTVDLDFVQILLDALAARGLEYEVVVELIGLDVELPSALGIDVRHTDREVILARSDLGQDELKLANEAAGHFSVNCSLPSAVLGPIPITRGWVSVDAKVRGKVFRFISTHLDGDCLPFTAAIQQAQAAEILSGPANTTLPIILAGDLNATPDGDGAAYNVLAGGGFQDAWSQAGVGPGLTCCQADDLLNPVSQLDSRIDFVLHRPGEVGSGEVAPMAAIAADVVGDQLSDRTAGGLWPSDHSGVAATLRLGHP